jgi:hypothetical protein
MEMIVILSGGILVVTLRVWLAIRDERKASGGR